MPRLCRAEEARYNLSAFVARERLRAGMPYRSLSQTLWIA